MGIITKPNVWFKMGWMFATSLYLLVQIDFIGLLYQPYPRYLLLSLGPLYPRYILRPWEKIPFPQYFRVDSYFKNSLCLYELSQNALIII